MGSYTAYLNAGYLEDGGHAVLLAQAAPVTDAAVGGTWAFSLTALKLQVNGPSGVVAAGNDGLSVSTNPIYVEIDSSPGRLYRTSSDGIPYFAPTSGDDVEVTVLTGVTTLFTPKIEIVPIARKDNEQLPAMVEIGTATPPDFTGGTLTFNFEAPSNKGISNIGFDVEGVALAAARSNGLAPVKWHIRNGIDVGDYDNGYDNITNKGAGILFAFGGAVPTATDVFIGFAPPAP
jgi:hypothetical protein